MNVFTCGEEIIKLAAQSSKKYHLSQLSTNLNIYQNIFKNFYLKIAPSNNEFSKFFS